MGIQEFEYDFSKLKGRIVEKYGSQTQFAKAMNTYTTVINRKLLGKVSFTHDEIVKWCYMLDIPEDEIGIYFFTHVVKS